MTLPEGATAFVGAWTKEELVGIDKTLNEDLNKENIMSKNDAELLFKTGVRLVKLLRGTFNVSIIHGRIIIKLKSKEKESV